MVKFIRSDLDFILNQIRLSERHAAGEDLRSLLPNVQVPWGLRTVTGQYNNLVRDQSQFGAGDNVFPRLTTPVFHTAEAGTSYAQVSGLVIDSQPRIISNLIVDQTAANPAAVAAAAANGGAETVISPGLDGTFGTADDKPVFYIPNVTPDAGLTVPFNSWMTFFGQFFDHGLDLVTKGGSGTVFIPLQPDDPLYVPGSPTNFMVLTRATNQPGPDGILGTADDIHEHTNTTSPFIDQNQTYTSHPSHQVFLRAYELVGGKPMDTGKLITNRDLGADGKFGTGDDTEIGGMATWKVVKAQARDLLGINLTDSDVFDLPLLATDEYGNFLRGPNGFAQVVMKGLDGIGGTADDVLVEGNPLAPISLTNAVRTGHAFLNDIAHAAAPNPGLTPDGDNVVGGGPQPAGTYDNELLDAHYIAGDGRVNENIGLTAVHSIFHSEHNRLVEHTKQTVLDANDLAFLNEWLRVDVAVLPTTPAEVAALQWDGQRLFQAAKFGTEMQYQHLVFEEFARTIQPNIDEFLAPNGYDTTIDPSIVAEFAHTVYRFGHSMLTETIDRLDPNFNSSEIGLIAAFLNPLAFAASGPTPDQAVGAIVRGVTRQAGNEIDEFVTEALRNNLVGLPLDLAVLNLARGRDAGIPSLNEARRQFYAMTGDGQLKPYTSWADLVANLKHPESVINFIAAYGIHPSIQSAGTLVDKRAAATLLVLGDQTIDPDGIPNSGDESTILAPPDRMDFLNSTGLWASEASGRTTTGLDDIDFWIGGLAEEQMPFGGLLGSTFNFVFETQLESLQNADRFYYLSRTAGMNFGTELEANSFAKLVMLNSDATHLPANIFQVPTYILEVDQTKQFNSGLGSADPTVGDFRTLGSGVFGPGPIGPNVVLDAVVKQVIRDNPATPGLDSNYLHYTGIETVVLGGTTGNDILIAGDSDDDTLYGDAGDDYLDGGYGDDTLLGGAGDDVIQDQGGNDTIDGGDGNDVIHGGAATQLLNNLILGGAGKDFIITGEDTSITFGGGGDDFIYGTKVDLPPTGNEGDDWIELGTQDGAPGDNFNPLLADDVPGNDIFVGGGGFDEMIGEGGDDIFVGSDAQDKMLGMSGFDWVTYKNETYSGVTADLELKGLAVGHGAQIGPILPVAASPSSLFDRFAEVEGMSGSNFADVLYGDNVDLAGVIAHGIDSTLRNLGLITGIQDVLGAGVTTFAGGNIILGGGGSDIIVGRGGDDLIDGDKWLNVRISVHANIDGTGPEIASFDSMKQMIPLMLNRTYNPGQLVATREILSAAPAFDTAVFRGNAADYAISTNIAGDVITVTDTVVGRDGSDTLMHVERLQFNDITVVITPGLNAEPVGAATITDLNGGVVATGDVLRASIPGVTDADGIAGPVTYTWQKETVIGTGLFEDIILPGFAVSFQSVNGATFKVTDDLAGFALRVKALYSDGHGVTEQVFSAATAPVAVGAATPATTVIPDPIFTDTGPGVFLNKDDLRFVLDQIVIAERNAAGEALQDILPNVRVPYGLRTVTGVYNNLIHTDFGAADTIFPRETAPQFNVADVQPANFFGPGPAGTTPTSYAQTSGFVFDSDPRTISNLIVDQTPFDPLTGKGNPAASAAADQNAGAALAMSPGLDGLFGTADDKPVLYMPNTKPDFGLTVPFNSWMTFFGQFFDHGLDLVAKGGNGAVFVPLQTDDPLYVPGSPTNFMVLTRATMRPGPDGVLGTADDIHENLNNTSPFVDQNQTYSSHPSHQVFLRAYEIGVDGRPHDTGKLITNRSLGGDGIYGTADDVEIGGMATWGVVKAQARDILGINLTDAQLFNLPLLATDEYGNFVRGPLRGMPMVVVRTGNGPDGIAGNADDTTILVEGDRTAPVSLTNAVGTGHQFLNDIAHSADPSGGLVRDNNGVIGGLQAVGTYDGELLDAHYIAGDGRVNENIGLTAVHAIFHAEHNRLVDQTKHTAVLTHDASFLNEWLLSPVTQASIPDFTGATEETIQTYIDSLDWNGQRLFQTAKFGTEMQYQHLVFEEFARAVQPEIDIFFAPTQVYDVELDAKIVAEFAHTVYRFGHSMLTETVDRLDPNFDPIVVDPLHPTNDQQLGLIAAFLNPLAYAASGVTPEEATGAIVRGVTRQAGNEIDEFVTEALRNNLVGLPLDLAVLNLARGRDTGIPSFNAARADFYAKTGDGNLKPYTSWADFIQHMKHPESLINFIAAYGTHSSITSETTFLGKRAAATLIVLGGVGAPTDRFDFLNSTGDWASTSAAHPKDLDGVSTTGLGNIDFWIGGLAEEQTPFGGLLGSTFNFIFENQLEKLQDGDRFYYLERTAGLHFGAELEGNSFAKLIMANTDATHLPGLVFMTPAYTLEVDQSLQFTGLGIDGRADPTFESILLTPEVMRDNPDTVGPDSNYLRYNGAQTVVLGGTAGDDVIIGGNADDDTLWGDAGNDFLDGGYGNDMIRGGAGDDIIIDMGGDDNIQGGDGNDVIQAGNGINLIIAGSGNDFIVTGEDANESFGGEGNDFILGTKADEQNMGGEGDDWIEGGTSDGSPGDNFDPLGLDRIIGNDVYVGQGENDKFNAEGGDDIMVGSQGFGDRYIGGSGFDWATFKDDPFGITLDVLPGNRFFDQPVLPGSGASVLTRFDFVEGYAGSAHADVIKGDDFITFVGNGAQGSVLTNVDLIAGLQALLNNLDPGGPDVASFDGGNILLGGDEGDWLEGRGGNDLIDGDAWLNVRISVRENADGTGAEIASFDSMRPLTPFMLSGTYNPGQLVIVREIKYAPGPDFDTAVFTGNLADYTITVDVNGTPGDASDDIVTVTDNVGLDGTDTLLHIERLQFADQAQVLAGANQSPVGNVTVIGVVAEDQLLRASVAGVSDGNNTLTAGAIAEPVAYFWQSETAPGVFTDIVNLAAGEVARAGGPTFTPTDAEVGQRLRVRAVYKDQNGVLEEVYSAPTAVVANVNDAPTGAPTISDTTPTEDIAITALTGGISDPDGLTTAVFSFQWQSSTNGVTWTDIPLATGPSFTPLAAQVNLLLRVRVQFTDDHGTIETLFSAPTANVGDHITGNNNANTLNGGAFADWLEGLGGADNLNGNGGDDLLDGGNGNDTLNGGAGADTLFGGAGADTMNGGTEADTMSGGAANDTYIVEDAGDVVIELLGEGTDTVQTSLLTYTLGSNVENLAILAGSTGNRVFTGNGLNNTITGNGGNDFLSGLAGDDTLNGGGANDTLDGGAGIDTLNGGAGNDTASYASETDAMFINLAAGNTRRNLAGAAIEDTLLAIENATGGAGADTITGSNAANVMSGGGGADTFLYTIGGGADTVDGGAGVDTLVLAGTAANNVLDVIFSGTSLTNFEGGSVVNVEAVTADMLGGTDTLTYAGTTVAVSVNLTTGAASGFTSIAGIENATGGDGADTLTGAAGVTNTLTGGGGNDTFDVHETADVVSEAAGGGIDTVNSLANTYTINDADVENLTFIGVGNFTGTGNGSDNVITGGAGTDVLNGGGGADTLVGGLGIDSLNGGAGDDRMIGGAGNDIMNGNAGNDTFVMGVGFGADIISGFDASPDALNLQDRIDLVGMSITSGNFAAHVSIVDLGNDTLVTVDGNTITLLGVNGVGANVITIADFILAP